MKPRDRIAAIEARLVPGGMALAGRPDQDLKWLLARLKRAEELLDGARVEFKHVGLDFFAEPIRAFLEGEE